MKPQSKAFISACLFRLCIIKLNHMGLLENCHRSHSPPPAKSCGRQQKYWGGWMGGGTGVVMNGGKHYNNSSKRVVYKLNSLEV